MSQSVNFLHLGGLISSTLNFLERWEVVIITEALIIVVNAETKLDHAVNASSKLGRLVEVETRCQEGSVEEEPDEILDSLVRLVCSCLFAELTHDGVLWVHLHSLLGYHVRSHGVVTEGLGLHDAFHVGRPTVLRGGEYTWRVGHAIADNHLLDLVTKDLLHELGEGLKLGLELLKLLLLILILNIEALLCDTLELLAIEFLELLDSILINWVNHVDHLQALLAKGLNEGR